MLNIKKKVKNHNFIKTTKLKKNLWLAIHYCIQNSNNYCFLFAEPVGSWIHKVLCGYAD